MNSMENWSQAEVVDVLVHLIPLTLAICQDKSFMLPSELMLHF